MRRYKSSFKPRSIRRYEDKSKKRLIWSIIISLALLFIIFKWVLPLTFSTLIVLNKTDLSKKTSISENIKLAPPVLNIPYEATNTATIKIKGYSMSDSTVKIFLDDNLVSSIKTNSDGAFETDSINLSSGINNITSKTVDDNGHESLPSKTIQVIYDNEKPKLEVSQPSDGQQIKGGDKKLTVSGTTNPDNIVNINGSRVIINRDGSFSQILSINDGDNNITIEATNSVGNTTTISRKVTYTAS